MPKRQKDETESESEFSIGSEDSDPSLESESEEDAGSDSDFIEEEVKPKKAPAKKTTPAKRAPAKKAKADESADDDEEKPKKSPKPKAPKPPTEPTTLADGFVVHPPSLIYKPNPAAQGGTKIAAIDLDGTMIARKSNAQYGPRDADDWRWLSPNVVSKIKELHAGGHQILIVSNQGAIKGALTGFMSDKIRGVISGVLAALENEGVPAQVILATKTDENRKPATGMWDFFVDNLNGGAVPDKAASFFVGDAAGRDGDINGGAASDKEFAANVGIAFHTPDDFFELNKAATDVNSGLAAAFQELGHEYRKLGEGFKASAFLKVANAIREFPRPITSSKDLKGVPGVGKSSQAKVDEYIATGKIAAIDDLKGAGAQPAVVSKQAAEAAKFF